LSGLKVDDLRIWDDYTPEWCEKSMFKITEVRNRIVSYDYITWEGYGTVSVEYMLNRSKELTKLQKYLLSYENNNE